MTEPLHNEHQGSDGPQSAPAASTPDDEATLADLVAPLWTEGRTRRALGLSSSVMADRRQAGSLLALTSADDGGPFYPIAQFERHDGRVRVRPALQQFMMVLRTVEPWTVAVLIHTPAPELSDLSPIEWCRQGRDVAPLCSYAVTLLSELGR